MTRKNFLRDITIAIAASLLPKILQPCVPEIEKQGLISYIQNYGFKGYIPELRSQKPKRFDTNNSEEADIETLYALTPRAYKQFNDAFIKAGREYLKHNS